MEFTDLKQNSLKIGQEICRFLNGHELILASNSPRRAQILDLAKVPFKLKTPEFREEISNLEKPEILVQENSLKKVESISHLVKSGLILGADTIVVLDDEILGKPQDESEAFLMLKRLNGNWHQVYTGVALLNKNNSRQITGYEVTKVKFNSLTDSQIREYVATGDPLDKAGAYGIQESAAGGLVEKIEGNFDNVMGLPLHTVRKLLSQI